MRRLPPGLPSRRQLAPQPDRSKTTLCLLITPNGGRRRDYTREITTPNFHAYGTAQGCDLRGGGKRAMLTPQWLTIYPSGGSAMASRDTQTKRLA
ncbi:MAG: hypothetical protein WCO57_07895 [Verrucomicrobiota bacterium]